MRAFWVRAAAVLLIAIGGITVLIGCFGLISQFVQPRAAPARAIAFLIPVAIGGGLVYGGIRLDRRASQLRGKVAGRAGNYVEGRPEARWLGEQAYEVHYQPPVRRGKHMQPSLLTIRAAAASPTILQFKPETWFDRFGKQLGIASEVQTGDAEFDDEVYVRTSSPDYAQQLLAIPDNRLAVRALLRHGMKEVRLSGTHAEVAWPSFNPTSDDRPELAEDAAAGLFVLAGNLPGDELVEGMSIEKPSFVPHTLLWCFVVAVAATIICAFVFPPIHGGQLFSASTVTFVVAYPLFAVFAALLLRGTSTSHDHWRQLTLAGLFLIALGSCGTIAAANALADASPATVHNVPIVRKWETTGSRGSRSHHVAVADWDGPGTIDFQIARSEYDRIMPGRSQLELVTRKGWLGIEWLKSKRVR